MDKTAELPDNSADFSAVNNLGANEFMNSPVKLGDVQIEDHTAASGEGAKEEMKEVSLEVKPTTEADTKTVSQLAEADKGNPYADEI